MNRAGRPPLHVGCLAPDCDGKHTGRGYCAFHYRRLRRFGDALYEPDPTRSGWRADELRFLLDCGEPVTTSLDRVGWTAEAAYRWATRHNDTDLKEAVRAAYNAVANRRKKARKARA